MRAVGQPDRGRGAADLLHRHHVREIAHAGAAVFLLDGDAEQAERAQLGPQVGGEVVVAVDGGGARRDLGGGEGRAPVAQHVRGLAEAEVEAGQAVGQGGHGRAVLGREAEAEDGGIRVGGEAEGWAGGMQV